MLGEHKHKWAEKQKMKRRDVLRLTLSFKITIERMNPLAIKSN